MPKVYTGGFSAFKVTLDSRATFDSEERARELVNYLLVHPHFAPNYFGQHEPLRRLTPKRLDEVVDIVINRVGQELDPERVISTVFFARTQSPRCSYSVEWARLPHKAFSPSFYHVEQEFVRDPVGLEEWLSFVFGLLRLHEAWYADFALPEESSQKHEITYKQRLAGGKVIEHTTASGVFLEHGIPGVYWGNYFGPFYVDWFGREKFETLPCVEKRWLDTGGIFFTTAPTPFDWDTPAARQLQQAVKEYLGADAFFDIETVRWLVRELEPIPETMKPEQFQPPRRVPTFPFTVEPPRYKSIAEEIEDARRYFEGQGYTCVGVEDRTVTFHDGKGGILQVTVGPGGTVVYQPKL